MSYITLIINLSTLILSILGSWFVAYQVNIKYYDRNQKIKQKNELLTNLMSTRHALTEVSDIDTKYLFFRYLNSAVIIFSENEKIIEVLTKIKDDQTAEDITELLRLMAADIGIDSQKINDDFLVSPFIPFKR